MSFSFSFEGNLPPEERERSVFAGANHSKSAIQNPSAVREDAGPCVQSPATEANY